jgi:hypothetical protein
MPGSYCRDSNLRDLRVWQSVEPHTPQMSSWDRGCMAHKAWSIWYLTLHRKHLLPLLHGLKVSPYHAGLCPACALTLYHAFQICVLIRAPAVRHNILNIELPPFTKWWLTFCPSLQIQRLDESVLKEAVWAPTPCPKSTIFSCPKSLKYIFCAYLCLGMSSQMDSSFSLYLICLISHLSVDRGIVGASCCKHSLLFNDLTLEKLASWSPLHKWQTHAQRSLVYLLKFAKWVNWPSQNLKLYQHCSQLPTYGRQLHLAPTGSNKEWLILSIPMEMFLKHFTYHSATSIRSPQMLS